MQGGVERIEIAGSMGAQLAARIDMPAGPVRAWALFAHCFTCSKDFNATRGISGELARLGIAVMRFDFTGLGSSGGDFASTGFSANVEDLVVAAGWLRENRQAPQILIGHSLGGAAVIAAAGEIPEVRAVATINAPADAAHVKRSFAADFATIEQDGQAEVTLAGRTFTIRQDFVEDLERWSITQRVATLRKALLILHSPTDETVGIDNATSLFVAARHPKSFVSLDGANHLLERERDAVFAARMIASWADRYLSGEPAATMDEPTGPVVVRETHNGKFQNSVKAGRHHLLADEPPGVGGLDSGPSPYDYLAIALGACTSMTLRMYAERKGIDIGTVSVSVDHRKIHATDCEECSEERRNGGGKIDRFERRIAFGDVPDDVARRLIEIADMCPVHKTLGEGAQIVTRRADSGSITEN